MFLLDITTGLVGLLIRYLERIEEMLEQPPERTSIFAADYDFSFPEMRVSVQLSEERLRYDHEARMQEMARASGYWGSMNESSLYSRRSVEEYEKQAKRKVVQEWTKVRGDIYKPLHKRAVILGDPGFGKSWLMRWEGRELARLEKERIKTAGTAGVIIPVFARLAALTETPGNLIDRLEVVLRADAKKYGFEEEFRKIWPLIKGKIENGHALLLLDGWDEVRVHRPELQDAIEVYAKGNDARRVYLTSRIAGYEQISLNHGATQEWELVSFTIEQVKTFVRNYFQVNKDSQDPKHRERREKGTALLNLLQSNHKAMGLGRIPLMAALLCRIAWQTEPGKQLPTRRVEIYERCLWGLVRDWKSQRQEANVPKGTLDRQAQRKLNLLSEVAFKLLLNSGNIDSWRGIILAETLKNIPGSAGNDAAIDEWLDGLENDGILVRDSEGDDAPLRFIHRTFQEYSVASAIANRIDKEGWQAKFKAGAGTVTAERLIDAKSWDPTWQEVITLLAGKLDSPDRLLAMLANPKTDDKLRHRLCLAALSLNELKLLHDQLLVQDIAEELFKFQESNTRVCDINRALAAAGSASQRQIENLFATLNDESRDVYERAKVARLLADIGRASGEPSFIVNKLIAFLRNERGDVFVRASAASVLGRFGQVEAFCSVIVEALLAFLRDPRVDIYSRSKAAVSLANLVHAARRAEVVGVLLELLRNEKATPQVLAEGTYALSKMGQAVAVPVEVIESLLLFLRDNRADPHICPIVALALGSVGLALTDASNVAEALISFLRDEEASKSARFRAVIALCNIAETVAEPSDIISTLIAFLRGSQSDKSVRYFVAESLSDLGQVVKAASHISEGLLVLHLDDSADKFARSCALAALAKWGQAVAVPKFATEALLDFMQDHRSYDRAQSRAFTSFDPGGHIEGVWFDSVLDYENDLTVRSSAATMLGKMSRSAFNPAGIVDTLLRFMDKTGGSRFGRATAPIALRYFGDTISGRADVINALVDSLNDHTADIEMRSNAAATLEALNVRVFDDDSSCFPWRTIEQLSRLYNESY